MIKIIKNKNSGFTLVEVLLYVVILSVLFFIISLLFFLVLQSRVKGQTVAEVEQNGQRIMQIVTQNIRNADSISATSATSLSLSMPGPSTTIFSLSGSTFQMREGAGANIALSNSRVVVSGLNIFSNVSRAGTPGVVKIQFTLTHTNLVGRNEYDYAKTFYASATLR